jgi:HEPN domain-containing protein
MVNSIREEALGWWKEALYNLKQAKKIFEIKKFSVAFFYPIKLLKKL